MLLVLLLAPAAPVELNPLTDPAGVAGAGKSSPQASPERRAETRGHRPGRFPGCSRPFRTATSRSPSPVSLPVPDREPWLSPAPSLYASRSVSTARASSVRDFRLPPGTQLPLRNRISSPRDQGPSGRFSALFLNKSAARDSYPPRASSPMAFLPFFLPLLFRSLWLAPIGSLSPSVSPATRRSGPCRLCPDPTTPPYDPLSRCPAAAPQVTVFPGRGRSSRWPDLSARCPRLRVAGSAGEEAFPGSLRAGAGDRGLPPTARPADR